VYSLSSKKAVKVKATAYSLDRRQCNDDLKNTATMSKPTPGWTVAVSRDLQHLLGETVYIEGYGIRKIEDLMNPRFTKKIDLLMPDKQSALDFGVKDLTIIPLS
jgi:3D (Asp-Asp-Asp) domain-containing protein